MELIGVSNRVELIGVSSRVELICVSSCVELVSVSGRNIIQHFSWFKMSTNLRTPSDFVPRMISTPGWGLPPYNIGANGYQAFGNPMTPINPHYSIMFSPGFIQTPYNPTISWQQPSVRQISPGTLNT